MDGGNKPRTIARDISESLGKLPPQDIAMEEAILGAAMLERDPLREVMSYLQPEHFYLDSHQRIFSAIQTLYMRNDPVDMRTVVAQLRSMGWLEVVGGAFYIAELTSKVSSSANIAYHSSIIINLAIKRECIHLASQIHHDAYEDETQAGQLIEALEKGLLMLSGGIKSQSILKMQDGLNAMVKDIAARTEDKHGLTGVPSGYSKLDRVTHGFQNSDLIILAARPAMGKTSMLLGCCRNAAVQFNKPVAIISCEMSSQQLIQRLASMETEIPLRRIRSEVFNEADYMQLTTKIGKLTNAPIYIVDAASMSISELRTICRQLKHKHGIKLIGVDYVQLLKGEKEARGNREQEIASISRGLKSCAKELNVPIIALAQLSREVEKRPNKIPQLSDIRESGSLEADSDLVMFLYRPEYYQVDGDDQGTFSTGLTKVIIAKHRNGSLDDAYLTFVGKTTSFKDCEHVYTHQERTVTPPPNFRPVDYGTQSETKIESDDAPF